MQSLCQLLVLNNNAVFILQATAKDSKSFLKILIYNFTLYLVRGVESGRAALGKIRQRLSLGAKERARAKLPNSK
jgi:hypothetical protein